MRTPAVHLRGMAYYGLSPSRLALMLLSAAYLLAVLLLFSLPWHAGIVIAFAILLALLMRQPVWRDVLLQAPSSCVALLLEDGVITLFSRAGDVIHTQVMPSTLVTPMLTILNVLPEGKGRVRSVIIFPDSLDDDRFRELRVKLKWGGYVAQGR